MSGLRCRPARVRRPLAMRSRGSTETGSREHIHQRTTKRTGRSLAWLWTAANTVSVTCPTKTSGCNQTRTQRPSFRAKTMHANRLLSTSASFAIVLRYPRCCVTILLTVGVSAACGAASAEAVLTFGRQADHTRVINAFIALYCIV